MREQHNIPQSCNTVQELSPSFETAFATMSTINRRLELLAEHLEKVGDRLGLYRIPAPPEVALPATNPFDSIANGGGTLGRFGAELLRAQELLDRLEYDQVSRFQF